jgi:hypothetical protein
MSTILYYSNYCKSSNKVLQLLSKYDMSNQIHFICIDGRVNKNGNTYAVLPNGQEMLIPKNITAVPALLILNQQYKVVYGINDIINFFQRGIEQQVNDATKNNTVPVSTSADDGYSAFGGFGGGIVSDHFSFLDQDDNEMSAQGNGGLRQMHNYARPNENILYTPGLVTNNNSNSKNNNNETSGYKIKDGDTSLLDKYKQERDKDLQMYGPKIGYN